MWSKNKAAQTVAESRHVERVKLLPCGVCEEGGGYAAPSEAHEIEQGLWFTSLPLCADCHRGAFNGIHGQGRIWKVKKLTELIVLDQTIEKLLRGSHGH
jgi:hypothetical protein